MTCGAFATLSAYFQGGNAHHAGGFDFFSASLTILDVELHRIADVGKRIFVGLTLGVTALKRRAVRRVAILITLDNDRKNVTVDGFILHQAGGAGVEDEQLNLWLIPRSLGNRVMKWLQLPYSTQCRKLPR